VCLHTDVPDVCVFMYICRRPARPNEVTSLYLFFIYFPVDVPGGGFVICLYKSTKR